ncbi:MAG: hypothetical protein ACE5JU_14865 [Candidatus Binatia bacterium]
MYPNAESKNLVVSGEASYGDLRAWLEEVSRLGELRTIRGADRDLEMAGIWEIVSREGGGVAPALLFDEIPGFPRGHRVLFGQLESVKRLALTLRLSLNQMDIMSCVGYYANCGLSPVHEPVIHVKTVLRRNNPILTCAQPAKPPADLFAQAIFRSALIWDEIEKAGVPGVRGVWCDLAGGTRLFNVVSIKQAYPGHSRQAGMIASQCGSGVYIGRYTVVVDDDIDVTDLRDVVWAIATRSDPERSVEIVHRCRSSSADPALSPDVKTSSHNPDDTFTSKAIIDACWPYEWKNRAYPVAQVSPELRGQLLKKWGLELKDVVA